MKASTGSRHRLPSWACRAARTRFSKATTRGQRFPARFTAGPLRILRFPYQTRVVQEREGQSQPTGEALCQRFNLEGFPTLLILDAEGHEVRRHVGYLNPA